mmetsp:Transcript_59903/g.175757  ORF Transcript_59903/g.175757 Transcript_59903/m.175757 type:complete len:250 (-) Transcript_59903:1467-2216(-)
MPGVEARLQDAHARRGVCAMEEVGLSWLQALQKHGWLRRRLHLKLLKLLQPRAVNVYHLSALPPLRDLQVEHRMLAPERVDDLEPVRHLLLAHRVLVRLAVPCQDALERGVDHDLKCVYLLLAAAHHLLGPLAGRRHFVDPVPGLLQVIQVLEPPAPVAVDDAEPLRHGHRPDVPVVAEGYLLRPVLPVLAHVAERAGEEAPAQPVHDEVAHAHGPLGHVVLVHAAAEEHLALVLFVHAGHVGLLLLPA